MTSARGVSPRAFSRVTVCVGSDITGLEDRRACRAAFRLSEAVSRDIDFGDRGVALRLGPGLNK